MYIRALVSLLRTLGFKLTTVTHALQSPYGRYACITFDGLAPALEAAETLAKRNAPATVFVSTRGGPSLKLLPQLARDGWEVGSLGHELVDLTTQGYGEQRRQVSRSKSLIAAKIGRAPSLFAYPFGAYDATTVSCVRDEGFLAAVTLRRGLNNGDLEAFHLKRMPLTGSVPTDFSQILKAVFSKATPDLHLPKTEAHANARSGAVL